MSTVHQFPVQRNQPPAAPEEVADALGVAIDAAVGADASFEAREAAALALTNEATRLFLERELLAIADGHGTHVEVDGVIYQRHEPGIVRYFTLCGAVDIERWTYREMGVRNGPTLVPLDLDAGLGGADDPGARLPDCPGLREGSHAQLRGGYDGRPPMSALAQHAGTGGQGHRDRGHAGGASHRTAPAAGRSGCRTAPSPSHWASTARRCPWRRTSRPARRPRRVARRGIRPYTRKKPAPVNVNYRMAYVGTISFHDADGTALATRRYTAAAHESPTDRLVRPMMADLRHALRQVPALAVGVIQDGAPELWNLLRPALLAEPLVRPATKRSTGIISPSGSPTSYGTGSPTRPLAGRGCLGGTRASTALTTPSIASAHGVRDRYADALARSDRRLLKQLAPHLTYLENNADLMHYARLRAVGLPVGSGVTEGACKSVIKMRTNGSSQRWRPTGLEAVLTLRSMHMSDRLPRFWANFARGYRKEVTLCA